MLSFMVGGIIYIFFMMILFIIITMVYQNFKPSSSVSEKEISEFRSHIQVERAKKDAKIRLDGYCKDYEETLRAEEIMRELEGR